MNANQMDRVFFALSDQTRRAMLAQLTRGPASVSDLARNFDQSLPAISKHVRVLKDAGLLTARANPADRRSKTCTLESARLTEAAHWIATHHAEWVRRLTALEALLDEEGQSGATRKRYGKGR